MNKITDNTPESGAIPFDYSSLPWLVNHMRAELLASLVADEGVTFRYIQNRIRKRKLPIPLKHILCLMCEFDAMFTSVDTFGFRLEKLEDEVFQIDRLLIRTQQFNEFIDASPVSPFGISAKTYLKYFSDSERLFLTGDSGGGSKGEISEPMHFEKKQYQKFLPIHIQDGDTVQLENGQPVLTSTNSKGQWEFAVNTFRFSRDRDALLSLIAKQPHSVHSVSAVGNDAIQVLFRTAAKSREAWNTACNGFLTELGLEEDEITPFASSSLAFIPGAYPECDLVYQGISSKFKTDW